MSHVRRFDHVGVTVADLDVVGPDDHLVPFTDQLRLAVAAYLARFKGSPVTHRARSALLPRLVR